MGTHPIFESDFDCLTEKMNRLFSTKLIQPAIRQVQPSVRRLTFTRINLSEYTHDYDAMVGGNKIVVFMKGTPDAPQCGFSRGAIQILEASGVEFDQVDTYNILDNEGFPNMRDEMKNFPTGQRFRKSTLVANFTPGSILCSKTTNRASS